MSTTARTLTRTDIFFGKLYILLIRFRYLLDNTIDEVIRDIPEMLVNQTETIYICVFNVYTYVCSTYIIFCVNRTFVNLLKVYSLLCSTYIRYCVQSIFVIVFNVYSLLCSKFTRYCVQRIFVIVFKVYL